MRKTIKPLLILFAVITAVSCKKDSAPAQDQISQDVLDKVYALGFTNKNVQVTEGGYIVEGDIFLSEEDLNSKPAMQFLRVGTEEQYRTFNLVTALPRTIRVSISNRLPVSYVAALDEALARYNALGMLITFQRVSSGADINVVKGNGNFLASAGFPTSSGDPYSQVKVNSNAIGNQPQATVATILAHEIGHCIGFRHTDYMNRAYSCGGQAVNEGSGSVGAVHIPGTPTGPDPNSWMLSCIGSGQNRPFNNNDRAALLFLY
ncbi:MAG TPA: M57 family metalloprotease [Chitinophagaceae bacterium]|nr:M57 family metalloprotease [Chitinophagaceae bacterium]